MSNTQVSIRSIAALVLCFFATQRSSLRLWAQAGTDQNRVTQSVLGAGQSWQTPIYFRDSGVAGPTVIVTGGIHGNEPSGAASAEQIRHWSITRGKLIVIPRVNTAALDANRRYIPKTAKEQQDLNRNFPSPGLADGPRGEIATALWQFVVEQDPDWLFDLHEGFEFNVSHHPKSGKAKSVGSTIIFDRNQLAGPLVERMLRAANATVSRADRVFVPLSRGPVKRSLASAVINVLEKRAMIVETTFKSQSLSIRTRQHREMMAVAFRELGMLDQTPRELHEFTLALDAERAGIKNYVVPTLSDVYYGPHQRQVLDFWQADSQGPSPLVFVIHGGGWNSGSKDLVFEYLDVRRLLENGLSVVSINYRYLRHAPKSSDHPPVRTPLIDAVRALQFVRSKATEWNLDQSCIGGYGADAGACTGLWLALHDDLADKDANDPIARQSTRLTCLAVSGAQTTLDPNQIQKTTPNSRDVSQAFGFRKFEDFLAARKSVLPWIQEYSPYAQVTADDPPIALLYPHPSGPGVPQGDLAYMKDLGVKLRVHCNQNGVECDLYDSGTDGPKYTSQTDYLIERLKQR